MRRYLIPLFTSLILVGGCAKPLSDSVRQDIAAQMTSKSAAITACYAKALVRERVLAGSMPVTFVVTPAGDFSNIQFGGTDISSNTLQECVRTEIAALKLASPPPAPVNVTYPLVFEAQPAPQQ